MRVCVWHVSCFALQSTIYYWSVTSSGLEYWSDYMTRGFGFNYKKTAHSSILAPFLFPSRGRIKALDAPPIYELRRLGCNTRAAHLCGVNEGAGRRREAA